MNKQTLTAALIATLATGLPLTGYGQVDQSVIESINQNDRQEHIWRLETERQAPYGISSEQGDMVKALSSGFCVSAPFPSAPSGVIYSATVHRFSDTFNVDIWRVGCDANNSNVLVRVSPVTQSPFICEASLHVLQADNQYDARLAVTPDAYSGFCDNLLVPKTFLLGQWSSGEHFDDDAKFSIVWGDATINVGGYAGAPSGCAQGGVSHYTPATGTLNIPSVELPSGKCYDVQMQIIPPYDTLNFTVTSAVKK